MMRSARQTPRGACCSMHFHPLRKFQIRQLLFRALLFQHSGLHLPPCRSDWIAWTSGWRQLNPMNIGLAMLLNVDTLRVTHAHRYEARQCPDIMVARNIDPRAFDSKQTVRVPMAVRGYSLVHVHRVRCIVPFLELNYGARAGLVLHATLTAYATVGRPCIPCTFICSCGSAQLNLARSRASLLGRTPPL